MIETLKIAEKILNITCESCVLIEQGGRSIDQHESSSDRH